MYRKEKQSYLIVKEGLNLDPSECGHSLYVLFTSSLLPREKPHYQKEPVFFSKTKTSCWMKGIVSIFLGEQAGPDMHSSLSGRGRGIFLHFCVSCHTDIDSLQKL